jgi:hypothetical protein
MSTQYCDTKDPIVSYLMTELSEIDGAVTTVAANITAVEAKVEALEGRARRLRDALRCLGYELPNSTVGG